MAGPGEGKGPPAGVEDTIKYTDEPRVRVLGEDPVQPGEDHIRPRGIQRKRLEQIASTSGERGRRNPLPCDVGDCQPYPPLLEGEDRIEVSAHLSARPL